MKKKTTINFRSGTYQRVVELCYLHGISYSNYRIHIKELPMNVGERVTHESIEVEIPDDPYHAFMFGYNISKLCQ